MATLKDVAREAGLTVTTVSRVLNNRGYISEDARKKVADAMKKLNYRPNEVARSLHSKKSNTIGVIVPHIRHPYFAEMISNLENAAYKKGYKILLCNSQSTKERAEEYIDICNSNRVAGLIICSTDVPVDIFSGMDIPVITIERALDNATASVVCDNKSGGQLAAERLIKAGCKKLLYLGSSSSVEMPAHQRGTGFIEICENEGVPCIEVDPEEASYNNMTYNEWLETVMKEHLDSDGMFASSDIIAAQALQVCRKLSINVPEDMKIVGFDDVVLASLTTPQLTTIHQPIKEMAEIAINLLDDAANDKLVAKQTILPVVMVERETV